MKIALKFKGSSDVFLTYGAYLKHPILINRPKLQELYGDKMYSNESRKNTDVISSFSNQTEIVLKTGGEKYGSSV